jgi:pyridoxamine 5'-phosphate oxidase
MDPFDLAQLRRAHEAAGLDESDVPDDPMVLAQEWLAGAVASGLAEPNAMVVSTVGPEGLPSSRLVLCKELDRRGPVFYTNYHSRKARELADHPAVSVLFPWHSLGRQVRIEGAAGRVTEAESDAYFATRPRGAQLSAWASEQSGLIDSRVRLEDSVGEVDRRYPHAVPRPPHWGGIRVVARSIEFWQSRPDRLHDRLLCRREDAGDGGGWSVVRLQP